MTNADANPNPRRRSTKADSSNIPTRRQLAIAFSLDQRLYGSHMELNPIRAIALSVITMCALGGLILETSVQCLNMKGALASEDHI